MRTVDRCERIRTYNFPENRISDHRIGFKAYNLDAVLDGDLDAARRRRASTPTSPPRLAALGGGRVTAGPRRCGRCATCSSTASAAWRAPACPSPRVDAELLLAHVLGVPRGRMFLSDADRPADAVRFEALLVRRAARVPLQHLLGERGVPPPRRSRSAAACSCPRPETELRRRARRSARCAPTPRQPARRRPVHRLGRDRARAGHRGRRQPVVHAVELDEAAHGWAAAQRRRLRRPLAAVGSQVVLHRGDATTAHLEPLAELVGRVDVVVSNPPYIPDDAVPRDPEVARARPAAARCTAAHDGLDVVRGVAAHGGRAAAARRRRSSIEHGDAQGEAGGESGVPHVLREHGGWLDVVDHPDLAGRARTTDRRPRLTGVAHGGAPAMRQDQRP